MNTETILKNLYLERYKVTAVNSFDRRLIDNFNDRESLDFYIKNEMIKNMVKFLHDSGKIDIISNDMGSRLEKKCSLYFFTEDEMKSLVESINDIIIRYEQAI